MQQIKNWKARRSGAHITITGVLSANGAEATIPGVTHIDATAAGVVATTKTGQQFALAASALQVA